MSEQDERTFTIHATPHQMVVLVGSYWHSCAVLLNKPDVERWRENLAKVELSVEEAESLMAGLQELTRQGGYEELEVPGHHVIDLRPAGDEQEEVG